MAHSKGTAWGLLLTALMVLASTPVRAESPLPGEAGAGPGHMGHSHRGVGGENCPAMGGDANGPGWPARMEELGLTPEQKGALKTVMERYQPKGWELAQRGRGVREQLSAVSPDDSAYAAATEQAATSAAEIAADLVKLLSELRAEIHGLLTVEQRQRLQERASADSKPWNEWRERHRAAPR